MIIHDMDKLNTIWGIQQRLAPNSFGRLEKIKIRNCLGLIHFPCYVKSIIQSLRTLTIIDCKYLEEIFNLRGVNERETHDGTSCLPVAVKQQHAINVSWLTNLMNVDVRGCDGLKYLIPTTVGKELSTLTSLTIERCPMMEVIITDDNTNQFSTDEIFDPRGVNARGTDDDTNGLPVVVKQQRVLKINVKGYYVLQVMFPNLERMSISYMDKLNTIWGMQQRLVPNSFGRLYSSMIRNCLGFVSIFPCYIISMIPSLENLTISDSKSHEEIFDLQGVNERETHDGTCSLPIAVKQQLAASVSWFPNLMHIDVKGCGRLKHLLPATVAKELSKLKSLTIERCPMMEVLIIDDNTNQSFIDKILFPNFEEFIIIDVDKLNTICHWLHYFLQLPLVT
ncbi:hypothetical protein L6164_000315 [Bauhinia variegata]|uniref:Uncharacterized protein n=1 Tax=Bauhinia variegata TaxID=167791 RepID=A0ACB9Q6D9_BAUVA|nr:hypothetical protein L6164_000315 [Bauhinia variegata]